MLFDSWILADDITRNMQIAIENFSRVPRIAGLELSPAIYRDFIESTNRSSIGNFLVNLISLNFFISFTENIRKEVLKTNDAQL